MRSPVTKNPVGVLVLDLARKARSGQDILQALDVAADHARLLREAGREDLSGLEALGLLHGRKENRPAGREGQELRGLDCASGERRRAYLNAFLREKLEGENRKTRSPFSGIDARDLSLLSERFAASEGVLNHIATHMGENGDAKGIADIARSFPGPPESAPAQALRNAGLKIATAPLRQTRGREEAKERIEMLRALQRPDDHGMRGLLAETLLAEQGTKEALQCLQGAEDPIARGLRASCMTEDGTDLPVLLECAAGGSPMAALETLRMLNRDPKGPIQGQDPEHLIRLSESADTQCSTHWNRELLRVWTQLTRAGVSRDKPEAVKAIQECAERLVGLTPLSQEQGPDPALRELSDEILESGEILEADLGEAFEEGIIQEKGWEAVRQMDLSRTPRESTLVKATEAIERKSQESYSQEECAAMIEALDQCIRASTSLKMSRDIQYAHERAFRAFCDFSNHPDCSPENQNRILDAIQTQQGGAHPWKRHLDPEVIDTLLINILKRTGRYEESHSQAIIMAERDLRKGRVDSCKAHIETAMDLMQELLEELKEKSWREQKTRRIEDNRIERMKESSAKLIEAMEKHNEAQREKDREEVEDTPVRILFLGGNETQARYQQEIDQALQERNIQVQWIFSNWESNWNVHAETVKRAMGSVDGAVIMRFVRTQLGESARKSARNEKVPWVACTGHGRQSIQNALERAARMAREKKKKEAA